MTPIRVAFDAGPLYGPRTGVGAATAGMRRALEARDDVALTGFLVSARATPAPGDSRLPIPGIVASHLWSRTDLPRADRWLDQPDVVHGTNYVAPPTRIPTVISVYDCWFLEHPGESTPLVRRAGERLRRMVARGAWVHTTAEAVAERTREVLATDRVVNVPLGPPEPVGPIDTLAVPGLAERLGGRPFVLALGTHERRKDLPVLVAAFAHLADEHPDVLLVLAGGPGDDSPAIEAAITALPPPVAHRVITPGFVDDATKAWLLRRATVLAYPSRDEGFGFPVLEAQLAGIPVVASRVGALPEVAGDGARLVDDRRPEGFAAALGEVLTDDRTRDRLVRAGTVNLRRFDWRRTADGLLDLYRVAIDHHPRSTRSHR